MNLGISGKVAFVVGGSKGIARPVSSLLAKDGAKVAIVARDKVGIDKAVAEVTAEGGMAMGVSADLSTQQGIDAAIAQVRDKWGSPDICVAQISATNPEDFASFFNVPAEAYAKTFDQIVGGYIRLAHAVLPHMLEKKWGRFVHIGSITAKEPRNEFPNVVHNTVQSSAVSFLKSMSDEFAKEGVTFNSVAPGWVKTDMLNGVFKAWGIEPDQIEPWLLQNFTIPANRIGRPIEIASMVAFLCSDLASYCTGNHILVDGSMHRTTF